MADTDRRAEIDALLDAALDLPAASRASYVAAIADATLRAEVAELLAYADSNTDPLELNARAAVALLDVLAEADRPSHWQVQAPLPEHIGVWRVLERIGEGGMGEVLKVVREDGGFQQYGALKRVRDGHVNSQFARRFVQERQILARLNHPSIASLLDGGFDGQRHYLVMEYVEGQLIDRYCDDHRLGLQARLALFVEVAGAVAHAHRQLIVHRDLKPSNVLVRSDGHVKLLDFGIAKVLIDDGIDPAATLAEQRVFTPDYASPEQARGEAVGTASDVYQLGLLLYELLCGQRAQRIQGKTPAEIERAIIAHVPLAMSAVEDRAIERAACRGLTPAQLRRALRGDLQLIVSRAIDKDIERRYVSVDALLMDLERSQRGQPLLARPDTLGYRAWRFLRRHPLGVSFVASTLVLVIAYVVTLVVQSEALARERDRARAEADKARQVQSLVQRLFEGIDPDVSGGANLSVRDLLDRSFAGIERELTTQPEVRAELLLTVGDVYYALGEYQRAQALLTQASALAGGFVTGNPLLAARIDRSLGRIEAVGNDLGAADRRLERALTLLRAHQAQPADLATCLYLMADLRRRQDRWPEARAMSSEALLLRRTHLPAGHADLADSLVQLASIEQGGGHLEAAEQALREALIALELKLPATHPRLAETRADMAKLLRGLGRLDASDQMFEQAIAGLDQSRGDQHPFLGIVLNNHGNLLLELGRAPEAEAAQRRSLQIQRRAYGEVHARVALSWNSLGMALRAQRRTAEAVACFESALRALPDSHQSWRTTMLRNLGVARFDLGDFAGAAASFAQLDQPDIAPSLRALALRWRAESLLHVRRFAEADRALQTALALHATIDDTLELAEAQRVRGEWYRLTGNTSAAEAAFARSAALLTGLGIEADEARARLARARDSN